MLGSRLAFSRGRSAARLGLAPAGEAVVRVRARSALVPQMPAHASGRAGRGAWLLIRESRSWPLSGRKSWVPSLSHLGDREALDVVGYCHADIFLAALRAASRSSSPAARRISRAVGAEGDRSITRSRSSSCTVRESRTRQAPLSTSRIAAARETHLSVIFVPCTEVTRMRMPIVGRPCCAWAKRRAAYAPRQPRATTIHSTGG